MKFKALAIALGLVILSALPVAAQPANSKFTFGNTASAAKLTIDFKADATPTPTSAGGYGKTSVNFTCNAIDWNQPFCLPSTNYRLTLVDDATKAAAEWARIGKPVPQFASTPGVIGGSTAVFTDALNHGWTLAVVVDKNGSGAARSATITIEYGSGASYQVYTPPNVVKVTQAGQ